MKHSKKILAIALCAATVFSLAACGSSGSETTTATEPASSETTANSDISGVANPWVDVDDLAAAKEMAGFEMSVPDEITGYTLTEYRVMTEDDKIIEVIYTEDGSDKEIRIRKGAGQGDISGDFNNYTETYNADLAGFTYSASGNAKDSYNVANWSPDDNYTFSITSADGLTQSELESIISQVK